MLAFDQYNVDLGINEHFLWIIDPVTGADQVVQVDYNITKAASSPIEIRVLIDLTGPEGYPLLGHQVAVLDPATGTVTPVGDQVIWQANDIEGTTTYSQFSWSGLIEYTASSDSVIQGGPTPYLMHALSGTPLEVSPEVAGPVLATTSQPWTGQVAAVSSPVFTGTVYDPGTGQQVGRTGFFELAFWVPEIVEGVATITGAADYSRCSFT